MQKYRGDGKRKTDQTTVGRLRIWKETSVAYFEVPFRHSSGESEGNQKKKLSVMQVEIQTRYTLQCYHYTNLHAEQIRGAT
jgi:hypothetical protein